jgi:hypothetical protein
MGNIGSSNYPYFGNVLTLGFYFFSSFLLGIYIQPITPIWECPNPRHLLFFFFFDRALHMGNRGAHPITLILGMP